MSTWATAEPMVKAKIAVVITPVSRIYDGDKVYEYGDKVGATMQKIYDTLTGIQNGLVPDTHNWLTEVTR